eukprot:6590545-Pyramimonas_sp.AAC.1
MAGGPGALLREHVVHCLRGLDTPRTSLENAHAGSKASPRIPKTPDESLTQLPKRLPGANS